MKYICLLLGFLVIGGLEIAQAAMEQVDVFVGKQEGYDTFRIPSVIVTGKGTVLAFCEGRKKGSGDSGDIDLVLKRSSDGGKTWGKLEVVWDDSTNTCGNPCPVVDQKTGTIWLLLTHNLGIDREAQIMAGTSQGTRTVWVSRSEDDGVKWSKPVEITKDVKKADWTWYATGPGIGIQLRNGWMVVPCDHAVAGTKAFYSHVIVSTNGGVNWMLGGTVGPKCNECQAVELRDGSVLLNMRSYSGRNRRAVAVSKDGGLTFSEARDDAALVEPVCQASILRYGAEGERSRILFSNPASVRREKMTVRVSSDEGQSWGSSREIYGGPAAYSCLTVLPDGKVGCLYERGKKSAYEVITLATFKMTNDK